MQSWGLEAFAEKVQIIFTSVYVNFVVLLTPKEKYLLDGAENTHLTKASLKIKHLRIKKIKIKKFEPLSSQLLTCQGCVLHNLEFKFFNFCLSQLLSCQHCGDCPPHRLASRTLWTIICLPRFSTSQILPKFIYHHKAYQLSCRGSVSTCFCYFLTTCLVALIQRPFWWKISKFYILRASSRRRQDHRRDCHLSLKTIIA